MKSDRFIIPIIMLFCLTILGGMALKGLMYWWMPMLFAFLCMAIYSEREAEKDAMEASKPSTEEKWIIIRRKRVRFFRECDWWASSELTMSDAQKKYRQDLRDLPTQSDVDNITWPSKPSG